MGFSLDHIEVSIFPQQSQIAEITKNMIATSDDRSRSGTEVATWAETFEQFYFITATDIVTNETIGAISLSQERSIYGEPLFMIGSFYVKEEYRGIGLGLKMFAITMELTNGCNTALNTSAKMTGFYEKFGFHIYNGLFKIQARLDTAKIRVKKELFPCNGFRIEKLADVEWDLVAEYDRQVSEREREKYLKKWLTEPCAMNTAKVAVDDETGKVIGFICARRQVQNRLVVGPFYANNAQVAGALVIELLSHCDLASFEQIWFRFPETNYEAFRILDAVYDGEYVKIPRSMAHFNKAMIEGDHHRVFSVMEGSHSLI